MLYKLCPLKTLGRFIQLQSHSPDAILVKVKYHWWNWNLWREVFACLSKRSVC